MYTSPSGAISGDDVASSLMRDGWPLAGSTSTTLPSVASVVASRRSSRPLGRTPVGGTLFTTTYSVLPSFDSAGAALVAVLVGPAPGGNAAATVTCDIAPFAPMRTMPPPPKPAGLAPVTTKPKWTLPAASLVSGVLMNTVASNAAGLASYAVSP